MSGQWTGASLNRTWQHPGSRARNVDGDKERGARLYSHLAHEWFWCEVCKRTHPLWEHRRCRGNHVTELLHKAADTGSDLA
jgi:hypothetical protein